MRLYGALFNRSYFRSCTKIPFSHTQLTNRRIANKLFAGDSNGKRHAPNILYCNALRSWSHCVLAFHISGYKVPGPDLRLYEWWERANAISKAFFKARRSTKMKGYTPAKGGHGQGREKAQPNTRA